MDMETYYDMGTDYQCPSCRNNHDVTGAVRDTTLEDSTVQAAVGQLMDIPIHQPLEPLSVEVVDSPHVVCEIPEEASAMKGKHIGVLSMCMRDVIIA